MITAADLSYNDSKDVPTCMLSSHFVGVLPSTSSMGGNNIHHTCFLAHILIDNVIHSKKRDFTSLDQILVYYSAAFKTDGVPNRSRILYCKNLGIITGKENRIITLHEEADIKNQALIREKRPDDPNLNRVLEELSKL